MIKKGKTRVYVIILLIVLLGLLIFSIWYTSYHTSMNEQKVRIGIIDSGISEEQEKDDRIIATQSFVKESLGYSQTESSIKDGVPHGMYVTEIILEAKNIEVVIAKIASMNGEITIEGLRAALTWAINDMHVNIVNLSLGYEGRFYDILEGQIEAWTKRGVSFIAAAGNANQENAQLWGSITYPGASPFVLSVGAVDLNKQVLSSSSQGPGDGNSYKPDLVAIGISHTLRGTSFAAPRVTKTLAELWNTYWETIGQEPSIGILWWALLSSTTPLQPKELTGHGLLNEEQAIKQLTEFLTSKTTSGILTPAYMSVMQEPIYTNETRIFTFRYVATQDFTLNVSSNASYTIMNDLKDQQQKFEVLTLQIKPQEFMNKQKIGLTIQARWTDQDSMDDVQAFTIDFRASKGGIGLNTQYSLLREGTGYGYYWELVKYLHSRNYSVIFYDYYSTSQMNFTDIQAMLLLDVGTRLLLSDDLLFSLSPSTQFIQAFYNFIFTGGRAIIASKYGFFINVSSINEILQPFHIQYMENTTAPTSASDIAHMYDSTIQVITEMKTSPLFSTVLKFSYRGATLKVTNNQAFTGEIMANATLQIGLETVNAPIIIKQEYGVGSFLVTGASMLYDNYAFQNARATNFDMYLAINSMLYLTGFISI